MNILPKKRWHVRTKENIARVRRDEAKAAEEDKERERRIKLAELEARTAALRQKAQKRYKDVPKSEPECSKPQHVNFFEDLEAGKVVSLKTNAEYEKEKKEEKEKYEKQIGYLTYLGQDTVESTGKVSWYNKTPDHFKLSSCNSSLEETSLESKQRLDPMKDIRKYVGFKDVKRSTEIADSNPRLKREDIKEESKRRKRKMESPKKCKKSKRRKKGNSISKKCEHYREETTSSENSSSSSGTESSTSEESTSNRPDLEKLRSERLKREREEKLRAEAVLARLRGEPPPQPESNTAIPPVVKQKYNSQFNPELARQNFSQEKTYLYQR